MGVFFLDSPQRQFYNTIVHFGDNTQVYCSSVRPGPFLITETWSLFLASETISIYLREPSITCRNKARRLLLWAS